MTLVGGDRRAGAIHFGSERAGRGCSDSREADDQYADARKLRVMIVEDELFVAMHLESVLEEIGYEITGILSSGERAVDQFPRQQPDVILMDINLGSGIDGITAAEQIRAADDVRIVFVSAYSDTATRTRVQTALPGSSIVPKPVTAGALKQAIQAPRRH